MYANTRTAEAQDDATLAASAQTEQDEANAPMRITLDSNDLLRGSRAIAIRHNGAIYRLQSTKLGKLILTK